MKTEMYLLPTYIERLISTVCFFLLAVFTVQELHEFGL